MIVLYYVIGYAMCGLASFLAFPWIDYLICKLEIKLGQGNGGMSDPKHISIVMIFGFFWWVGLLHGMAFVLYLLTRLFIRSIGEISAATSKRLGGRL